MFLDDDLEQLKVWLLDHDAPTDWSQHDNNKLLALLSRHEAAEVIAEAYCGIYPEAAACVDWRKAAGKDNG